MLKIVVYDCGYGGELFANQLEEALPVAEIIKVLDWDHAGEIQSSPRRARQFAKTILQPYIGKVDLIIFANHLLSVTGLKYFKRKYKTQKFLGLNLKSPDTYVKHNVLVLATKPLTKTLAYRVFLFRLKRKTKTFTPDTWPAKINTGSLTETEIKSELDGFTARRKFRPQEVVLACAQFNDIKPELRCVLGGNLKIYDSFDDAIRRTCKTLKIRGGTGRRKK